MKKKSVESTNLEWVAYDEETATLYISFYSGKAYSYTRISPTLYKGLLTADSVGAYFYHHIKNNPIIKCEEVDLLTLSFE